MRVPLSAERWKSLEPLIDAAVDLEPGRRRAFVRESCAGDEALEAELEQLLAEYERVDEQFDVAAVERFPSLIDDSSILNAILNDRYRIERELGRGGMATVYLARDLRHDRDVAVKVLHPDLAAALGGQRFLVEIKTTARLQHPHILALHDSGAADGFLFYVMPYVEGQSLRRRLERERQLPIEEVVRIASEVASALDAAHAAGVIHRDIKPENILLHNGSALVADFGIAIAASDAAPRITNSGLALGTPQYMSPEQATGAGRVDARTDVYALGTMVFEMLAGEPPFTGATSSAILAKRAAMAAPPVRVLRAAVPAEMDAAVAKALSREPVDRYGTAGEFAEGLRGAVGAQRHAEAPPPISQRSRLVVAAASALVAAGALAGLWAAGSRDAKAPRPGRLASVLQSVGLIGRVLDSNAFVVVGDAEGDTSGTAVEITNLVRDDLRRWRDLRVIDAPAGARTATRGTTYGIQARGARDLAESLGAGRYVRASISRDQDSVDVSAALFDTRTDRRLSDSRVRADSSRQNISRAVESLAEGLVLRGPMPHVMRLEGTGRTQSLVARQQFLSGQVALEAGDFERAESEFFDAARSDPQYAQALVWLANVRNWRDSRDRPWMQLTAQAEQAIAQRGSLAPSDSMILDALRALAAGRSDIACSTWSQLTNRERLDFAGWYGLGACLRRDSVVIRDPRSVGGWRFRSSYETAVRAYEQAFRLQPSILRAFGGQSLRDLELLFFTASARRRAGAAGPNQFQGIPVWMSDSLTFIPAVTRGGVVAEALGFSVASNGIVEAIQHQRERFLATARMWRTEFPTNADAAEAVAVGMEMLGNAAALDTLRLARSLAIDADDRLRVAANEVLFLVKFSLPSDLAGLRQARALADSLMRQHPPTDVGEHQLLASLAALTGKAHLAAAYAAAAQGSVPQSIAQNGPALLAFASLGGPRDSLVALEAIVQNAISSLPESQRATQQTRWLLRAATLAYPAYTFSSLAAIHSGPPSHARLVAAAAAGDTAGVHAALAELAGTRRLLRPADLVMDGVLPEAEALNAVGDVQRAMQWLDSPLRSIRLSASQNLADVARTGPLVRAMALRATLAAATGDRSSARRWAAAVVALWADADAFLMPTVQRMKELSF